MPWQSLEKQSFSVVLALSGFTNGSVSLGAQGHTTGTATNLLGDSRQPLPSPFGAAHLEMQTVGYRVQRAL